MSDSTPTELSILRLRSPFNGELLLLDEAAVNAAMLEALIQAGYVRETDEPAPKAKRKAAAG